MRRTLAGFSFLVLLLLAACGGGSGSGPVTPPPLPGPGPAPVKPPAPAPTSTNFVAFESGQVRPLAWSSDGKRLFVTNTPANRLDIFTIDEDALALQASVTVGLEPVAVAVRNSNEVWVVNHLSDSVSIVDVGSSPRVVQTLLVGDEPRDIVFAGDKSQRAFITATYRGQNHPLFSIDDLSTPGLGRADVWAYDADALDKSDLNGGPLTIVNLFADSLRALAVSVDGSRVYAAAFMSGNQTTIIDELLVRGKKAAPDRNVDGVAAPNTGLIVKKENGLWVDEAGTDWSSAVQFDLPDYDVFEIDAMAAVPALTRQVSGVGTSLFNMAVNPVRPELYVSNTQALNHVRFEGPGHDASSVRGHIAETRIGVLTNTSVRNVRMNDHVDFSRQEGEDVPSNETARSLSQVTAIAVSNDGRTLYAAAFGSNKLAFIPTDTLTQAGYTADASEHLVIPGGGPSGLALSPDGTRIAVYARFDNSVVLVNTESRIVVTSEALFNPEPDYIVAGRPFLYDATLTSANGVNACSSCHLFADNDGLAWDLGNPEVSMQPNPNPFVANSPIVTTEFHPMKGPMTTQTFRGINDSGPQHWRGDRTGENRAMVNGEEESIEAAAFKEFNGAFVGLVGRAEELNQEQLQVFTDFSLAITPPPNPIRRLDNALSASQKAGRDLYFDIDDITGIGSCNHCHALDPDKKQFGTNGLMTFEGPRIAEDFKIPHLRNAYTKVGMFGSSNPNSDGVYMGDQVKGFGFLHDGAIDTLQHFFADGVFNFPDPMVENRANVIRFVMAMDSNLAPIVGQQITLANGSTAIIERVNLLEQRAQITQPRAECDLVVNGVIDQSPVSLLMTGDGVYANAQGEDFSAADLQKAALIAGQELTYTCVPPGNGERIAFGGV
ncbi:MAG: DNA-binding beta-propeller fold protein YncE [Halioglobus sp.]|jgi:DNA-binding beta-propeller fold protein YncE